MCKEIKNAVRYYVFRDEKFYGIKYFNGTRRAEKYNT